MLFTPAALQRASWLGLQAPTQTDTNQITRLLRSTPTTCFARGGLGRRCTTSSRAELSAAGLPLTTLYLQQKAMERALDSTTKWFPLLPVAWVETKSGQHDAYISAERLGPTPTHNGWRRMRCSCNMVGTPSGGLGGAVRASKDSSNIPIPARTLLYC